MALADPAPEVSTDQMLNAIRVAYVNASNPGAISYDPLAVPPPDISRAQLLNAIRLAIGGESQP